MGHSRPPPGGREAYCVRTALKADVHFNRFEPPNIEHGGCAVMNSG
jgi:hypothetical protein